MMTVILADEEIYDCTLHQLGGSWHCGRKTGLLCRDSMDGTHTFKVLRGFCPMVGFCIALFPVFH